MAYNDKNYLDLSGLTRYDTLIKDYIPITHGYYSNGNFYSDSELTTLITGESKRLYIDMTGNTLYEYNGNTYIPMAGVGPGGTNIAVNASQPVGQLTGDIWFKIETV